MYDTAWKSKGSSTRHFSLKRDDVPDGIQRTNALTAPPDVISLYYDCLAPNKSRCLVSLLHPSSPPSSSSVPISAHILASVMSENRVPSRDRNSGGTESALNTSRTNEAEAPHVYPEATSHQQPKQRRENNNSTPSRGLEHQRSNSGASASTQRATRVYSSTAEAIANFRPTPRQVISGIAPHVFDERKRRRSTSQHRSRSPKPYWHPRSAEKKSSPLRSTTSGLFSWEDYSIYLGDDQSSFTLQNNLTQLPCAI